MSRNKKKNKIFSIPFVLLMIVLAVIVFKRARLPEEGISLPMATDSEYIPAASILTPQLPAEEEPVPVYGVCISEVMPKNRATICDSYGNFSDYVELNNYSGTVVNLKDWTLSDKGAKGGWSFPDVELAPGEYLLVFADGADSIGDELHASFSLSDDETVCLYDDGHHLVSTLSCAVSQTEAVMLQDNEGNVSQSLYPTPGFPNSAEGYCAFQETLARPNLLAINEIVSSNVSYPVHEEYFDWVEIKNVSQGSVQLANYYLSDDEDNLYKWRFPDYTLSAGACVIVFCDTEEYQNSGGQLFAPFSLDSQHEQLYLSSESALLDYASVRDIPYGCSMGRIAGESGYFYFEQPSPLFENANGYRYVAAKPVTLTEDGVFDNVSSLSVELDADGEIYYTLDGTLPGKDSLRYSGPITVDRTTIIRAVSYESGAMPSRAATFSYFLNENVTLPIVSLVADDPVKFEEIQRAADKSYDVPANVAFYEDGGSFNLGCTVKLTGDASLIQSQKRGMRVKFRGAFGESMLHYDLFGSELQDFSMLSLRTGNDNIETYIRNEVAQDLAMEFSDNVVNQHGRYVILYVNGDYRGIYCIKEKICRQYVASLNNVSKDSVEITDMEDIVINGANNSCNKEFYTYVIEHDMTVPEYYEHVCSVMDIDSLIDWFVLQGQSGNWDMIYRNISFYRSTEMDGKWRMIYYDLDRAYKGGENAVILFRNIFTYNRPTSHMIPVHASLMKNEDYRERFTKRCAEALTTVFTTENMLAKVDELQAVIAPEVERDCNRWGLVYQKYQKEAAELRDYIQYCDSNKSGYCEHSIDVICELLNLSREEFLSYAS